VSAALDVVDDVGVDALTIRAVAAAVRSPPMSLYTHFANKEELLDLMYLEVSQRLFPDSAAPTWQEELRALARHIRVTLLAHPRWTPILSRSARLSPPTGVLARERLLGLMVGAGMSHAAALSGLSSAMLGTIGFVLVERTFSAADGESVLDRRFASLKTWFDEHRLAEVEPTTREALARAPRFNMNDAHEAMLQTLIAGLEHGLAAR